LTVITTIHLRPVWMGSTN